MAFRPEVVDFCILIITCIDLPFLVTSDIHCN